MKRSIIKIDENLCTGCGACVKGCHGGALQIVDGKARIVNEMYCDGIGACIGECPVGAITLEDREVEPYQEQTVVCHAVPRFHQFPIQLRLVNPNAPFLNNTDLILAADCTAFVYDNFHYRFMKNNSIVIACPKLDQQNDFYVEKLTEMIDRSFINTLTVIIMEVPCCRGLLHIAQQAQAGAKRNIPVKKVIIGVKGELQTEEWI